MPENTIQSDDHISLRTIQNMFVDIFRFGFKIFDWVISSIQKALWLFIVCCIIGCLVGYVYYLQVPRFYKTEMIVQPNDLTRKAYYEIIRSLNDLVVSQSYEDFASQLKIDKKIGREVVAVEALSINNESLEADTSTKNKQPFKVQLKTSNIASAGILQNALLNYLNSTPYLSLIKSGQKKIYEEKLEFINHEQRKLDSLVSNYKVAFTAMKMPLTFYNNASDPAALYQHALRLDSVKEYILKWLNNESSAVLLIDGFKKPATPQSVSLVVCLITGLAAGFAAGIILTLLIALKKAIV